MTTAGKVYRWKVNKMSHNCICLSFLVEGWCFYSEQLGLGLKVKQFQLSAWRRAAVPNYSRLDGVAEVLLQVLRHREGPDTKIYLLYHKHNRQKIISFNSRLQACYWIRFVCRKFYCRVLSKTRKNTREWVSESRTNRFIQVYMDKKNFIHISNIRFCNIISAPKIRPHEYWKLTWSSPCRIRGPSARQGWRTEQNTSSLQQNFVDMVIRIL